MLVLSISINVISHSAEKVYVIFVPVKPYALGFNSMDVYDPVCNLWTGAIHILKQEYAKIVDIFMFSNVLT